MEIFNQGQASARKQSSRIKQNACFPFPILCEITLFSPFLMPGCAPLLLKKKMPLKKKKNFHSETSFLVWVNSADLHERSPSDQLVARSLLASAPGAWLDPKRLSAAQHLESAVPRALRAARTHAFPLREITLF